ncbi:MAG: dihydropteroate synthase [Microbacteriaceae bacterium]|nr:dihydropteroate synthase [Microbacteriaceae bacterium]
MSARKTAGDPDRGLVAQPQIMGVLNITPNSFSDGGKYLDPDTALQHALSLVAAGATIIDVGGESTRPGAPQVSVEEEQRRILGVVEALVAAGISVSVDTMHHETAEAVIALGAAYINDVSGGLADPRMFETVAKHGTKYILSHWRVHSAQMDDAAKYQDAPIDVRNELQGRIDAFIVAGGKREQLIIDPGLGFSKFGEHNWQILRELPVLAELGLPILLGASRKRFIGEIVADAFSGGGEGQISAAQDAVQISASAPDSAARDLATAVLSFRFAEQGVWGVRVHDVAGTAIAFRIQKELASGVSETSLSATSSGAGTSLGVCRTALDEIHLTGLKGFGYHGVFDFEKREGQDFVVDILLKIDLQVASRTDNLSDTISYADVAETAIKRIEGEPFDLIERLAGAIGEDILEDDRVISARVTVHKPTAPIGREFSDVTVTVTSRRPLADVVVAFGSNLSGFLGSRIANIERAAELLNALPATNIRKWSEIFESAAVKLDGVSQFAPRYLNGVWLVETRLSPGQLLANLMDIERKLGRVREERWGDRTLDLDIIKYGDERIHTEELIVPHPRAFERSFVLAPWLSADPEATLDGKSVLDLASALTAGSDEIAVWDGQESSEESARRD